MSFEDDKRGATVKFPPPLLFLIWMLAGFITHWFWPMDIATSPALTYIGIAVILVGLVIFVLAARTLKSAKTNVEPWKPTTSIVSTGIFAYSRNPIYLGFCIVAIGVGILLNSFWVLFSFVPAAAMVYFMAIRKEEAYLEKKFAEDYTGYRSRVRRWL
jgi:protein-S-isoprenylcysteine O-methyltransferase Ste14